MWCMLGFFLVANEIKTAKANVVQRMNFIASTLGRGSTTPEWGVREVAPRAGQRGFLLGTAGGGGKVCLGELWQGFIGYCWG